MNGVTKIFIFLLLLQLIASCSNTKNVCPCSTIGNIATSQELKYENSPPLLFANACDTLDSCKVQWLLIERHLPSKNSFSLPEELFTLEKVKSISFNNLEIKKDNYEEIYLLLNELSVNKLTISSIEVLNSNMLELERLNSISNIELMNIYNDRLVIRACESLSTLSCYTSDNKLESIYIQDSPLKEIRLEGLKKKIDIELKNVDTDELYVHFEQKNTSHLVNFKVDKVTKLYINVPASENQGSASATPIMLFP